MGIAYPSFTKLYDRRIISRLLKVRLLCANLVITVKVEKCFNLNGHELYIKINLLPVAAVFAKHKAAAVNNCRSFFY